MPILGIGPEDGDAAALLRTTGAGEMIGDSNESRIRSKVLDYFDEWKKGTTPTRSHDVSKYSRKNITKELTDLF